MTEQVPKEQVRAAAEEWGRAAAAKEKDAAAEPKGQERDAGRGAAEEKDESVPSRKTNRAMISRNSDGDAENPGTSAEPAPRVTGVAAPSPRGMLGTIGHELKHHAPFTTLGALSGLAIMGVLIWANAPRSFSTSLFWSFHPLHVFLSALVTAGMYRLHSRGKLWATILVGYVGSVGIATLSDCVIPYLGESLLTLPNRGIHFGFIEKWWLVNPLAAAGIAVACFWPKTKIPHAGHVLLSTWASLFHMTMALGEQITLLTMAVILLFLFLAVWIPCCTSDIVFPLLLTKPSDP